MLQNMNLEFRKSEESTYDFVDSNGRRQSGISRSCLFMNDEELIIKVGIPKDVELNVDMKKGQSYDVVLDCKMKPYVDKNGNVSQKQFTVYYQFVEVLVNPFDSKTVPDKNIDVKNTEVKK